MAKDPPADPDRYDEAVKAFRRKVPLPDPLFRELEASERQRAFWVAGLTQGRAVQEVMDHVDRAIEQGTSLEQFKEDAGATLAEAWGGEDAPRLETVFRTNVMGAYNSGRTDIFSDPVVREARPFLRFDAAGDSRMTEICERLDGTVLPADHSFWKTHTPPLHFNCRSILTPLSGEEAEAEGVSEVPKGAAARPDEGFGRPSDPENWEPDLSGFSPELRSILADRLDDDE